MPLPRPLTAVVITGLVLSAAATGSAAAAPAASVGRAQVTVVLAPTSAPGLRTLAVAQGIPNRVAKARALQPSAGRRAAVADGLAALGLRVVRARTWFVTADGPAATVTAAFGSARAVRPEAQFAQALPRIPSLLQGLVVAALGGDDHRPAARPLFTGYGGPKLRAAYDVAAAAPTSSLTVATVQLSGWDSADLSHYARVAGLADPVAAGRYAAVTVGDGRPTLPDGAYGDLEVALDQEALLAVAPGLRQRAYVADNSLAGFIDAVYAVGEDALSATTDHHLAALSISWGLCEPGWSTPAVNAMENALAYATAAGVTVFAATGDSGVDDCGDGFARAVDFPASSPYVVAVGGTRLPEGGTETGWSGSGGGGSAQFAKPSWARSSQPGSQRWVPDIAAVADPETGFRIYTTAFRPAGDWGIVGGTSLAAPVSAALLANELASAGYDRGVGDIHPALYTAPASDFRDITTGGNRHGGLPGFYADPGYDLVTGRGSPRWDTLAPDLLSPALVLPTWSRSPIPLRVAAPAGTTYGPAGLGQPPADCPATGTTATPAATYGGAPAGPADVWLQVVRDGVCQTLSGTTTVDVTAPTTTAWVGLPDHRYPRVAASWLGRDSAAGVSSYAVQLARRAVSTTTVINTRTSQTAVAPFTSTQGYTYYLTVSARDRAGNSRTAAARTSVPIDDGNGFRHFSGWTRRAAGSAYLAGVSTSAARDARIGKGAYGRQFVVWLVRGPNQGKADLLVDGTIVKSAVDLYAPRVQWRYPVSLVSYGAVAAHTVSVRVRGDRNPRSGGVEVCVDALVAIS